MDTGMFEIDPGLGLKHAQKNVLKHITLLGKYCKTPDFQFLPVKQMFAEIWTLKGWNAETLECKNAEMLELWKDGITFPQNK